MEENNTPVRERTVFVSVVGRPNVGKSSLVNALVGEKVAIVTARPQTTRNRITGVLTRGELQYIFVDTPGVHTPRSRLGERMVRAAADSLAAGDVTVMVFEPQGRLSDAEQELIDRLRAAGTPALALINKCDALRRREELLLRMQMLGEMGVFREILPVSALQGDGLPQLLEMLAAYAADSPHLFDADSYTDTPEKQLVAEILREKMLLELREEVPHGIAVTVERFYERPDRPLVDIDVNIYCEKKSHKGMIIGAGGGMLKRIAAAARADCEQMLGVQVALRCWVKVRPGWRDNERMLNALGFPK